MEPQITAPGPSVEVGAIREQTFQNKERQFSAGPENISSPERKQQPSLGPSPQVFPILPTPQPSQVAATRDQSNPLNDNPLTANDDDLIEKEWVQKAKKIVMQTRDDPYTQEKEVSKLQADYIKKRYGKDIRLASD